MKHALVFLCLLLVGCGTQKQVEEVQPVITRTETVFRKIPDEYFVKPPPVTPIPDEPTQKDVAIWIAEVNDRIIKLEAIIDAAKQYNDREK